MMTTLYSQTCVQRPPLGPDKRGRYAEVYTKRSVVGGFRLAVRAADWTLLTGGRYSEVVVRTGLTVLSCVIPNSTG